MNDETGWRLAPILPPDKIEEDDVISWIKISKHVSLISHNKNRKADKR